MKSSIKSYAKAIFEAVEGQPKGKAGLLIDNLLALMSTNSLLAQLPNLELELGKINDEKDKIVRAKITTARQLTKKSLDDIVDFICKKTGAQQVVFETKIDESIGGGFIAYFKDTIIDASLVGAVKELATTIGR